MPLQKQEKGKHVIKENRVLNGKEIILTNEQVKLIYEMNINKEDVCVLAKAGASKSSTMVLALTDETSPHRNGVMLAFNKSAAEELKKEIPEHIESRTFHSLAYKYTVGAMGLKTKFNEDFNDFKEVPYYERKYTLETFRDYLKSDVTKIEDFVGGEIGAVIKRTFTKMITGETPISFSGYLKYFQILLANNMIEIEPVDILIMDEAQDANDCMGSIFLNFPAKQKVAIGDLSQQVNQWNGAGSFLYNYSKEENVKICELNSSMRCSPRIAKIAEKFGKMNLASNFTYKGSNKEEPNLQTFLYMTRTNSELIEAVQLLREYDISNFSFTRKVVDIFKVFNMILFNLANEYKAREKGEVTADWKIEDEPYMFLYEQYIFEKKLFNRIDTIEKETLELLERMNSATVVPIGSTSELKDITFLTWLCKQDENIFEYDEFARTAKVIVEIQKKKVNIYDVYKFAKEAEETEGGYDMVLSTGNSAKGLTADCSFMSQGLSKALKKEWSNNHELVKNGEATLYDDPDEDDNCLANEMANLYYVAFTRSRFCTIGATLITANWRSMEAVSIEYMGYNLEKEDFFRLYLNKNNKGLL
jgi:hypothetical protein